MAPERNPARRRLGAQIASGRARRGLTTQEALAEATGLSLRTIVSVENGDKVSPKTIRRIESAIGWRTGDADKVLADEEYDAVKRTRTIASAAANEGTALINMEIGTGEWLGYFRRRLSPEDYSEVLALWRMARQAQKERDAAVIEVHRLQAEVEALKSAERERLGVSGERT